MYDHIKALTSTSQQARATRPPLQLFRKTHARHKRLKESGLWNMRLSILWISHWRQPFGYQQSSGISTIWNLAPHELCGNSIRSVALFPDIVILANHLLFAFSYVLSAPLCSWLGDFGSNLIFLLHSWTVVLNFLGYWSLLFFIAGVSLLLEGSAASLLWRKSHLSTLVRILGIFFARTIPLDVMC